MLLSLHALSTIALAGLIWFVQVVHYPLFHDVGRGTSDRAFRAFARRHQRLTSLVVIPLMLTEAATAVILFLEPIPATAPVTLAGLLLLLAIWLSTAFLQVPQHRRLARGYDATAVTRLVRSNWLRTAAWTARAVLAVILISEGA